MPCPTNTNSGSKVKCIPNHYSHSECTVLCTPNAMCIINRHLWSISSVINTFQQINLNVIIEWIANDFFRLESINNKAPNLIRIDRLLLHFREYNFILFVNLLLLIIWLIDDGLAVCWIPIMGFNNYIRILGYTFVNKTYFHFQTN